MTTHDCPLDRDALTRLAVDATPEQRTEITRSAEAMIAEGTFADYRDALQMALENTLPPLECGHESHDALGSCGCTDYHSADCPIRTGESGIDAATIRGMSWQQFDDYMDRSDF